MCALYLCLLEYIHVVYLSDPRKELCITGGRLEGTAVYFVCIFFSWSNSQLILYEVLPP